ncbi:DUF11 domain-containing protein [Candidatus Parcubacteria bacterium]|nr:DUF11 domain-containing protein [Candidatus Parcubacteria bacterium]
MKNLSKSRGRFYKKFVQVFSLTALVLNMSFMGVFFIVPEAVATEPQCTKTLDEGCGDCYTDLILGEECDNGEANWPEGTMDPVWDFNEGYGDRNYCSDTCYIYHVPGTWCGDGEVQELDEECEVDEECDEGQYCDGCVCYDEPVCDPLPEDCTNQIDDDCDCLIDCDDPDCSEDDACVCHDDVYITIYKVECSDEQYLPNWGDVEPIFGEPDMITATTAADYINTINDANESEVCWLDDGWEFQWGDATMENPGNNIEYAEYANGWNTVGPTVGGEISFTRDSDANLKIREVVQDGYVPFSGTESDVSAEIYCHNYIETYDNYAHLDECDNELTWGETYYCVAFNAPEPEETATGSITIIKSTSQETGIEFEFFGDLGEFTLSDGESTTTSDLATGTYYIYEDNLLPDWDLTDIDCGDAIVDQAGDGVHITLDEGENATCTFYNTHETSPISTGTITICKQNDLNGNGELEEGEPFVDGWSFYMNDVLYTEDGNCVVIDDVLYGTYNVTEVMQEGWIATGKTGSSTGNGVFESDGSITVTVGNSNPVPIVYFLNADKDIWGCKYNDVDSDGPAGEDSTISGWTIELWTCPYPLFEVQISSVDNGPIVGECQVVDSTITGDDGCYAFYGLGNGGQYRIKEVLKSNWTQTYPTNPDYYDMWLGEDEPMSYDFYNHSDDPTPYCGDGMINMCGEECDDGNNEDGDGCSHDCKEESSGGGTLFPTNRGGGSTGQTSSPSTPTVLGEEGAPVLVISKTADQEFVNIGDQVEYIITVTNNGNLTAFEVNLEDLLPEGLEFIDDESASMTWDLGDISPGVSKSATVIVKVTGDITIGKITNTATAAAANHPIVEDSVDVEVREIMVLAESGFDLKELMLMIGSIITLMAIALGLKRRLLV